MVYLQYMDVRIQTYIACLACLLPAASAFASEYSSQGADACVVCHGPGMPQSAVAIFATPHGSRQDPAAPFAQLQCEQCHGPAADHVVAVSRGESALPPVTFGAHAATPAATQIAACLGCHDDHGRNGWTGSAHETSEVPCAACHQVHAERDRVFDALAQQETCFGCHARRRNDALKPSSHPLRFGAMSCSSCHDPHQGQHESLLIESSVNDTCFTCHAEKRGPFLWEHAPAAEDCSLCHQVHGSNHAPLLTRRPPLLCQQCHAAADHPGLAYGDSQLDEAQADRFLLARGCLNCHSQVHGSNHPSGATLHR
jgi:DmsE family decaheme c-type cytochrome